MVQRGNEVEEEVKPPLDGSTMSPAMCRRYALRGSGDILLALAASTICNAGLVRLPYADMLAPSQSSATSPTAPGEGLWGQWRRIIASFCSCRGSNDEDGNNNNNNNNNALTSTTSSLPSTSGCCCCAAVALESRVQQAEARSTTATPEQSVLSSSSSSSGGGGGGGGGCGSGVPVAEELLTRAIHHLCDADWADWLRVPLIGAASQGDLDTVKLLLKAGVGGHGSRGIGAWMIPGGDGRTLLHAAADSGNAGVIEALLEAGAGVVVNSVTGRRGDRQGSRGFSPFHVAVIKGSVPAAMALARAGAAVHRRAPFQQSALHLAAGTGNAEMVCALVTELRLAVEGKDDLGGTALHAAAWHGEADCVRVLLALGAQVDTRDECGRTPLFQACRCGAGGGGDSPGGCKAVCELVGAGADVNAKSEDGDTPLHIACRYGHTETVRLLLRHDADETTRCDLGKTPGDVARGEALRAARRRNRCVNTGGGGGGSNGIAAGGSGRGSGGNNDLPVEAAEAIHAALATAPAGRAWRRRGWLALLRARLIDFDKRRLSESAEEEEAEVCTGSFEVGARGGSLASVDLSVTMLVQDANGLVSLPQAWAAMDLEEERDFFGPLGALPEHCQENVVDFGMELDKTFSGETASVEHAQPRVSADCVRGLKRLCSRKHGFLDDALGGSVSGGFTATAAGGLEVRAMDVSADNFVDLSVESCSCALAKIGAPSDSNQNGGWGFEFKGASAAEAAACDGDGSPRAVTVGGSTNVSENCSGSSGVDVFYEVVLRTLEMADGPFEIIVGYV